MLERLKKLATNLRTCESQVEGDFKNVFGDRALQVESWIRSLENNGQIDETYVNEAATEFENLCRTN